METHEHSATTAEMQEDQRRFLRHMESLGLVVRLPLDPSIVPPESFEPIVVTGEPLSETIIKDRR